MARGSIVKRSSGSYAAVFYTQDKKQVWKSFKTRREAEQFLTAAVRQVDQGSYVAVKTATFEEFSRLWLERCQVRETTKYNYRGVIENHLIPRFGRRQLRAVGPDDVAGFVADLSAGELSPVTVGNALRVLKMMYRKAVEWSYCSADGDPTRFVRPPKKVKRDLDILTSEEINALLEAADKDFFPLLLCAVTTGMRQGELLGLTWDDIDWKSGRIHVRRSLSRAGRQLTDPKTATSKRSIPMMLELVRALKEWRLACPPGELNLVFPNRVGEPHDGNNLVKRDFDRALRKAGLRKIRFHDLRHCLASNLLQTNGNIRVVQAILGHSNATTTLNVYSHLLKDSLDGAMEGMRESLFGGGKNLSAVGSSARSAS